VIGATILLVVVVIMEVFVIIVEVVVVVVVKTLEAARELINNKSHITLYEIMTIFYLAWNLLSLLFSCIVTI
jgi:hypothetical protein